MSDEQSNNETEDPEVEGHVKLGAMDEPADEGDEDEVEGHVKLSAPRLDSPKLD
ncbi:MAG TPA: hypothetical protein VKR79_02790 [Gaiellaceae bacterium]|nr:hypothetical protein [Gaiellaceae bacterium]